ncbi:hypothetical protein M569_11258, partial [Genlisea aurea]
MGVASKFLITSAFMWILPFAILYGFNHKLCPAGCDALSAESVTLWGGIIAVISVNVVIALYIYAAMREPSTKHEPDPRFVSNARISLK